MMPAIGGKIHGHGVDHQAPAEISVVSAIYTPTTTVSIKQWLSPSTWTVTAIELDEPDRVELIELLGGTP